MSIEKIAFKILPALDRSLRHIYPNDYMFRCFQASVCLNRLLLSLGYESRIVSGDFQMAARNIQNGLPEFHGFYSKEEDNSHYWLNVEGHLIDAMPRYLVKSSPNITMAPPMMAWKMSHPLPHCIYYLVRNPAPNIQAIMSSGDRESIAELLTDLKERLSRRGSVQTARPVLMGPNCIKTLARKKDPWARYVQDAFTHDGPMFLPQASEAFRIPMIPDFQQMSSLLTPFGGGKLS